MKLKKRIVSVMLCMVMVMTLVPFSSIASAMEEENPDSGILRIEASVFEDHGIDADSMNKRLLGDYNNDHVITADDARITLRVSARLENYLMPEQLFVIDVNQDGVITAADARSVLRMSARLESIIVIMVKEDSGDNVIRYVVSFDVNCDDDSVITPKDQIVAAGECAEAPEIIREGYQLIGWYKSNDGSIDIFDFSEPINNDIRQHRTKTVLLFL